MEVGREGEGGMEVGEGGEYIPIATLSPLWPASEIAGQRWLDENTVSLINCEGQSHRTVSTNHNFWRERRAEAVSNRGLSAYQPTALPLGQTGSHSPPGWHWRLALYRTERHLLSGCGDCRTARGGTPTNTTLFVHACPPPPPPPPPPLSLSLCLWT